jgi:hypothetical protein
MPIACGINVNLNNLQGEIATRLNGFVNLSGTLGTPAGLTQVQSLLGTAITSITTQVQTLIPAVPVVPQSLRNDLASLFALPAGSTAALAGIAQFVQDYTGLENISGFVGLNLNDLAASVFSISGTFDPCAKSFSIPSVPSLPNIPNIIKNPVTGALEELPAIQPELGATTIAKATKVVQSISNNVTSAFNDNVEIKNTDPVETSLKNIQTNISSSPVKRPVDVPITLSSGNTYTGTIPTNMQEWSAKDANDYIKAISKLHNEGKVTNGALVRALALKKFHAEKLRLFNIERVEAYRANHPEFDDPSSALYHMFKGKIKLEEGPNDFNGKPDWNIV